MGVERRRWRDVEEAELAQMKPRRRKRVEKMLAKKNSAPKIATAIEKDRDPAEVESESTAVKQPSRPSWRLLYQPLEFRGVCVQNKDGKYPCPTVGKLMERGVSRTIQFFY